MTSSPEQLFAIHKKLLFLLGMSLDYNSKETTVYKIYSFTFALVAFTSPITLVLFAVSIENAFDLQLETISYAVATMSSIYR